MSLVEVLVREIARVSELRGKLMCNVDAQIHKDQRANLVFTVMKTAIETAISAIVANDANEMRRSLDVQGWYEMDVLRRYEA